MGTFVICIFAFIVVMKIFTFCCTWFTEATTKELRDNYEREENGHFPQKHPNDFEF